MIHQPRSAAQRRVERADKEGRFLKRVRRHPPAHRTRASSRVVVQGNSMKFRCTMMHQLGRPSRLLLSFLHLRHDARNSPVRYSPRQLHACTSLGKSNPVIMSTAGHRYPVDASETLLADVAARASIMPTPLLCPRRQSGSAHSQRTGIWSAGTFRRPMTHERGAMMDARVNEWTHTHVNRIRACPS